jgi:hypothetical protein
MDIADVTCSVKRQKTVIGPHMGGRRCRQQVVTAICLFATRHLQNLPGAQAYWFCYHS